jgi:protein-tyrosine phosphatase
VVLAQFRISSAGRADLDTVLGILNDATRNLLQRGIPTVWKPAEFSRQEFLEQALRGEVFIAFLEDVPVGTFILQWSDLKWWGDKPPDSGYIHKLAIRPEYAGKGIGVEMLRWAEEQARSAGKKFLRLNCLAEDPKIRDYYERAGFVHVDDVAGPKGTASLYEKRL